MISSAGDDQISGHNSDYMELLYTLFFFNIHTCEQCKLLSLKVQVHIIMMEDGFAFPVISFVTVAT